MAKNLTISPPPAAESTKPEIDLSQVMQQLAEVQTEIKAMKLKESLLKDQVETVFRASGASVMRLPNGQYASWGSGVVGIKPLQDIELLPQHLTMRVLNKAAIIEAIQNKIPLARIVSFKESRYLKITAKKPAEGS